MSWAYWKQVLIALDQLLNTLFRGYADETLSSRAWRHSSCYLPYPARHRAGFFYG